MNESNASGGATKSFLGALLMGVGGLIAALCGLCTVTFVANGLGGPRGEIFTGADVAVMALFIGGIPTLVGVLMFLGGRALRRAARRKP